MDDSGGSNAGCAYLVSGPVSGGTHDLSAATAKLVGEDAGDEAGVDARGLGDLNGDGYDDVLVAAWRANAGGGSRSGAAYIMRGPLTGSVDLSRAAAFLIGEDADDQAGNAISALGDQDGDGILDLIVGAYGDDSTGSYGGAAYIVSGAVSGIVDLSSTTAKLRGNRRGDYFGTSVGSAGDVDGDGLADMLVGAVYDEYVSSSGQAYLFLGPVTSDMSSSSADTQFYGRNDDEIFGWTVGTAGDHDGDGTAELYVGAVRADQGGTNAGAVYLFDGQARSMEGYNHALAVVIGENAYDTASQSVSAEDLDLDGYSDLLVGAYESDAGGADSGAVYACLGPLAGTFDLSDAAARYVGESAGDEAGTSANIVDDTDGDGYPEVLFGGSGGDAGGSGSGTSWLFLGGP